MSPSVLTTLGAAGWIPLTVTEPCGRQRKNALRAQRHTRTPGAGTRTRARPAPAAPPRRQRRPRPPCPRRPGTGRQRRPPRTEEEVAPRREPVKGSAGACGARAQGGPSPSSRRRTMGAAGLPWAALWALLLPLVRTDAGPRCRAGRARAAPLGPALADGAAVAAGRCRPRGSLCPPSPSFPGACRLRPAGPAQLPSPAARLGWAPPAPSASVVGRSAARGVWASWARLGRGLSVPPAGPGELRPGQLRSRLGS